MSADITVQQHFITFFSPGTFVAERTTKELDEWNTTTAVEMSKDIVERHGARPYAFQFITRGRSDADLDSKIIDKSGLYYLGGTVSTFEEVTTQEKGSILHHNMKLNEWRRVINTSHGWTLPFRDEDVVLPIEKSIMKAQKYSGHEIMGFHEGRSLLFHPVGE